MKSLQQHIEEKLQINSTFERVNNFDINDYLRAKHVLVLSFEDPEQNACEIQYKFLELKRKIAKYKDRYIVFGESIGCSPKVSLFSYFDKSKNDILYLSNSSRLIIILPLSHIINYNYDVIYNLKKYIYDEHKYDLSFDDVNNMFYVDITHILNKNINSNKFFIKKNKKYLDDIFDRMRGRRE